MFGGYGIFGVYPVARWFVVNPIDMRAAARSDRQRRAARIAVLLTRSWLYPVKTGRGGRRKRRSRARHRRMHA